MSTRTDEILRRLNTGLPGARVEVRDLTGTDDHFEVTVATGAFELRSPVDRHRAIYAALGDAMQTFIHALSIKALSPSEEHQ